MSWNIWHQPLKILSGNDHKVLNWAWPRKLNFDRKILKLFAFPVYLTNKKVRKPSK